MAHEFLRNHRNVLPSLFAAAVLLTPGWMTAWAGNDNPEVTPQGTTQSAGAAAGEPPEPGQIKFLDHRKVDTSIESERLFIEALPVRASTGRVAVAIHGASTFSTFDKQLLLAVKEAATEFVAGGRNVPIVLLPDIDSDKDTTHIRVWADGDCGFNYKVTKDDKISSSTMTAPDYQDIKGNTLQLMNDGWEKLSRKGAPEVAGITP